MIKFYLFGVLCALFIGNMTSATCCDQCLSQKDPATTVIRYDPLVHNQCSAVKGICCYGCSFNHGNLVYSDGIDFNDKGEADAIVGRPVTISITGVLRVTYEFLAENQIKTTFVGNWSAEAKALGDGQFTFCAKNTGTIAFRGWGSDTCHQVTEEYSFKVLAGPNNSQLSCDSAATTQLPPKTVPPTLPVQPQGDIHAKTGSEDIKNCHPTRGTVKKQPDQTMLCQCLGDWSNPPLCDEYSWTKTIITVLGAFIAVVAIAFSVRAYVKSKRAEKELEEHDLDVTDTEIETMNVSPVRRQRPSDLPMGSATPSSVRRDGIGASTARRSSSRHSTPTFVSTIQETTL